MEKLFKCPRCRKGFDTYQIMDRHKKKCTGIEEIQETSLEIIERLKNELSETKTENRQLRYRLKEKKTIPTPVSSASVACPGHIRNLDQAKPGLDFAYTPVGWHSQPYRACSNPRQPGEARLSWSTISDASLPPDPPTTLPKQVTIRVKRTKTTPTPTTSQQSTILDYLQTYCPDACDIMDFIDQIVFPTNIKELFKERTYTNVMLDIMERSWKTIPNIRQKPMYRFPPSFMELPPTPQEVLYIHHEGRWMKESFPNIFITTTVGYKMLKRLDDRLLVMGVEYIKSSPNYKTTILGIFMENTLTPCTNVLIQDVMLSGIYG